MKCPTVLKLSTATVRLARAAVYLLYAVEAGAVLIVAPWTPLWERGRPVWQSLGLERLLEAHAMRGFVTGVGVALVLDALIETLRLGFGRRGRGSRHHAIRRASLRPGRSGHVCRE